MCLYTLYIIQSLNIVHLYSGFSWHYDDIHLPGILIDYHICTVYASVGFYALPICPNFILGDMLVSYSQHFVPTVSNCICFNKCSSSEGPLFNSACFYFFTHAHCGLYMSSADNTVRMRSVGIDFVSSAHIFYAPAQKYSFTQVPSVSSYW